MDEVINIFLPTKIFFIVFSVLLIFNVWYKRKPTVWTDQNKVLTSLCKRKQIMVRFMAFSCKTGSINRCLGLDVLAPAPGGFPTLLARLSLQLKIISPRMCLAFIFLYLICSLSALWSPVSMCLLQYTHVNLWISGRWRGGGGGPSRNGWGQLSDAKACPCKTLLWGCMQK